MSVSGGQSWQHNQNTSNTSTQFPAPFLKQFQDIFGPGFGTAELIAGLPRTQGLFGGQAGLFGTQPATAAPSATPGGVSPPPVPSSLGMGAPTGSAAQAPGGVPSTTPAAPRAFTVDEILGAAGNDPLAQQAINVAIQKLGGAEKGPFTLEQLQQAGGQQLIKGQQRLGPVFANLGAQQTLASQMPTAPRFAAEGGQVGVGAGLPGGVSGAVSALGFGAPTAPAEVQTIRNAPTINAAQVDMSKQLPGYQQAIFESQFRPVERELNRQGGLQQQQLAAGLAQRGLAGSAAGVGQQQRAQREVNQQVQFAAEDAANRASTQRFQLEYDQAMANAGFNQQAQIENAHNVLTGDIAKADNYLKTMGLNADTASKQKNDFLRLLGLQQQDLQRMDQFSLSVVDRLLNTWLQTASVVSGAGQVSTSQGSGHTHTFDQSVGMSGSVNTTTAA